MHISENRIRSRATNTYVDYVYRRSSSLWARRKILTRTREKLYHHEIYISSNPRESSREASRVPASFATRHISTVLSYIETLLEVRFVQRYSCESLNRPTAGCLLVACYKRSRWYHDFPYIGDNIHTRKCKLTAKYFTRVTPRSTTSVTECASCLWLKQFLIISTCSPANSR